MDFLLFHASFEICKPFSCSLNLFPRVRHFFQQTAPKRVGLLLWVRYALAAAQIEALETLARAYIHDIIIPKKQVTTQFASLQTEKVKRNLYSLV